MEVGKKAIIENEKSRLFSDDVQKAVDLVCVLIKCTSNAV